MCHGKGALHACKHVAVFDSSLLTLVCSTIKLQVVAVVVSFHTLVVVLKPGVNKHNEIAGIGTTKEQEVRGLRWQIA